MSRYVTVQCEFKDQDSLIEALSEVKGWSKDQIEIHENPQNLYGYHGDARQEKANIIVRRKYVGAASNDLGFLKEPDGKFTAIISEHDQRHLGVKFLGNLKGSYAFHIIKKQQEKKGRKVTRRICEKTKKQLIEISGYK